MTMAIEGGDSIVGMTAGGGEHRGKKTDLFQSSKTGLPELCELLEWMMQQMLMWTVCFCL
jgi:hypothetical protein